MNFLAIFASILLLSACGQTVRTHQDRPVGDDGGALRVGTGGTGADDTTMDSGPRLTLRRNQPVVFSFQNRGSQRIENLSETSATTDVYRTNCGASLAPGEQCLASFVPSAQVQASGAGALEVTYTVAGATKRWHLDVLIVIDNGGYSPPASSPWFPGYPNYPSYPTATPTATPTPMPTPSAPKIKFSEFSAITTPIVSKKVAVGQVVWVYAWNAGPGKAGVPRTRLDYNVKAGADCDPDEWAVGYGCAISYQLTTGSFGYAYITYHDDDGVVREARLKLTTQ